MNTSANNKLRNLYCLALLFAILATTGCMTTGTRSTYQVSPAPMPQKIDVAVIQFESPDTANLNENDLKLRELEEVLLPALLVDTLSNRIFVDSAYFSEGPTSATDFNIEGQILESNGRDLKLKIDVYRVDGKLARSGQYALSHPEDATHDEGAELNQLLEEIVSDLDQLRVSTNVALKEARAKAYAENNELFIDEKMLKNAETAADIEKKEILLPLTQAVVSRASAAKSNYVLWHDLATPLLYEEDRARSKKTMANISSGFAMIGAAASMAAGYQYAEQGNTYGVQAAQQNINTASQLMIQSAAQAEIAQNELDQIEATLGAYKSQFGVGATREITVRLYDKVRHLSGSQAEMLKQFHEMVKEELNSRSATLAASEGAAS